MKLEPGCGAGSSRPREPHAGQPGAGSMHARLRPPGQACSHLPCPRSRHPPTSRRAPETGGGDSSAVQGEAVWEAGVPGGGLRRRAAPCPVSGPRPDRGAGRAGLPLGTGAIRHRLRLACQVRVSSPVPAGVAGGGVPRRPRRPGGRAGHGCWRRGCRCPPRTARTARHTPDPGLHAYRPRVGHRGRLLGWAGMARHPAGAGPGSPHGAAGNRAQAEREQG